jgi:zinc/manganese transport system substrate-binding protein
MFLERSAKAGRLQRRAVLRLMALPAGLLVNRAHAQAPATSRASGVGPGVGPSVGPSVGSGPDASPSHKLKVVASFSILADMVRQIAGPAAEVSSLASVGADPHAYSPAPSDVQRLAAADLVVVNGLGFEGWIDRLVTNAGAQTKLLVASTGIEVRQVGRQADPHAWQSPRQAQRYIDNLQAGLLQALGGDAAVGPRAAWQAEMRHRAQHLRQQLQQLDQQTQQAIGQVPADARRAITAHNAFGYFGRDYGVVFTSLHGVSPEAEASAAQMARVVRHVRAQKVGALFGEATSDSRLLQRVADEAGIAVVGSLYADALSAPGGRAETYLQLVAHNARTITEGLQRGARKEAPR